MNHPIQPLQRDPTGVLRFKSNAIVKYLLRTPGGGLNELAKVAFPKEDWQQFAQLIGYSLDGYGTLSYVDDAAFEAASRQVSDIPLSSVDTSKS